MNIVKTWKFEFQTNESAVNAKVGERVVGSIGDMRPEGEPRKLGVSLKTDSGLLGYPPPDVEADIIQTVGPSDSVILKGQVLSVEADAILIELSFYK